MTGQRPPGDRSPAVRYTLVAYHAHPDDEALFTGGTLARYAAEGHRVVVVTATAGERGLAASTEGLGGRRLAELDVAAAALGVARVVTLGYADSGFDPAGVAPAPAGSFATVPVAQVADRVAEVLREERADALTVYDPHGGYGHRDHVHVHQTGLAAAALAGTPLVLEATLPREPLMRLLRLCNGVGLRPGGMRASDLAAAYRSRAEITHRVDVRAWLPAKRAALRAHASQASGGGDLRTVALLSALPAPLSRLVLGQEWYVEHGRSPSRHPEDDLFASLR